MPLTDSTTSWRSPRVRLGANVLAQDVRFALRNLRRTPGLTTIIIATLAIGIGAATAMFSVADAALFRPLPFRDAERLVVLPRLPIPFEGRPPLGSQIYLSQARSFTDAFDAVGAYATGQLNLSGGTEPIRVRVGEVTPNVFQILGVTPRIGRGFTADEEHPDAPDVAILSNALWRRAFGGDEQIVGKHVQINGRPFEIVGIMPPRFAFPASSELWIPLTVPMTPPRSEVFQILVETHGVAKLARGVSPRSANEHMFARMSADRAAARPGQPAPRLVVPLREFFGGDIRPRITIVTAFVALVVLMACVNVSGLLLARSIGRRREIAIRKAVGATRLRVVRQLLTESLVLAGAGAVLGVAVAAGVTKLFSTLTPPDLAAIVPPTLDLRVLATTLAISVATAIVFGVIPSLVATREAPTEVLKGGAGVGGLHHGARRLNTLLVGTEIALAVVLLVGSGLMLKSLSQLFAVDTGIRAEHVVSARVTLPIARYTRGTTRRHFLDLIIETLAKTPGIQAAAVVNLLPLGGDQGIVFRTGAHSRDSSFSVAGEFLRTSDQYFDVMGIRLLGGRAFTPRDEHVAVVNQSLAREWPNGAAIGGTLELFGDSVPYTIIGVVNDVKTTALDGRTNNQIYAPLEDKPYAQGAIVVRGGLPASLMLARIRDVIHTIDPQQPVSDLRSMTEVARASVAPRRASGQLAIAFGGFALVLAGIGVFGLLTFTVTERLPELGIRVALGAQSRDVFRLVLGDALRIAAMGAVIGGAAAFASARVLRAMLFEVSPTDPVVYATVPLVVVAVALAAAYQPGRRAVGVDPLTTMRAE